MPALRTLWTHHNPGWISTVRELTEYRGVAASVNAVPGEASVALGAVRRVEPASTRFKADVASRAIGTGVDRRGRRSRVVG